MTAWLGNVDSGSSQPSNQREMAEFPHQNQESPKEAQGGEFSLGSSVRSSITLVAKGVEDK